LRGRYFCRLELEEAIKLRKKIVLVHETEPSNGGHRLFGDYIDECMAECGQALARGELSALGSAEEYRDYVFGNNKAVPYYKDSGGGTAAFAEASLMQVPHSSTALLPQINRY
jgi:hypothetical protein